MESLFVQISGKLEAAGLADALTSQIGVLGDADGVFSTLAMPSAGIEQMATALQAVSLPQLAPLQDFLEQVEHLRDLVPADAAALIDPLTQGLEELQDTLLGDLIEPMTASFKAIQALYALLQGDRNGHRAVEPARGAGTMAFLRATDGDPSPLVDALASLDEVLALLPSPLSLQNVLPLLHGLLQQLPLDLIPGSYLPGISELQQTLDTILAWQGMDGAQLAVAFQSTLQSLAEFVSQSVTTPVQQAADDVTALAALVPLDPLKNPIEGITQGLQDLAGVVSAGDLFAVGQRIAELNAQVSQVNSALADLSAGLLDGQADALAVKLASLPQTLDAQMRAVLAVLKPADNVGLLGQLGDATGGFVGDQVQIDEFVAQIQRLLDWLKGLVDAINLQAIREPLMTVIDGAKSSVAEFDNLLVQLTTQVTLLFDEVDTFVDGLNVGAVTNAIKQALNDLGDLITGQIDALFEPVKTALASAVAALREAAAAFDLDTIVETLRNAIQGIADVLQNPDVTDALDTASEALDEAALALRELSFRPVTELVIAEIEDLTVEIRQIDVSALPDLLRTALRSALAVLPTDFQPITDALTQSFDDLMEAGPKPVLFAVKDGPEWLAGKVTEFSPENLIGDQISAPYQYLVGKLAAFKPSDLLKPVQKALEDLLERLQQLNPGPLLTPLEGLHRDLIAALDRLDPQVLVQPLSELVTSLVDEILKIVPQDEVFDQVDAVLETIDDYFGMAEALQGALGKLSRVLDGLEEPGSQVQELVDGILGIVDQIPDVGTLQPAFTAVSNAITATRSAGLAPRIAAPLAILTDGLVALDPGFLHSALVRAYRDFPRATVEALPASEDRTLILGFLDGFNPLIPDFARPFSALQTWHTALNGAQAGLAEFFLRWDELYHRPGGPFAEFTGEGLTAAALRGMVGEAIEGELGRPLNLVFEIVGQFKAFLGQIVTTTGDFMTHLTEQLAALHLIPEAVQAIRTAIQALIERVRSLDLSFLAEQVQDAFDRVKAKLSELIDPARIRAEVEATFNQVIGSLRLDALLPQAEISELDGSYEEILEDLRSLDPRELIVEEVQPEFEEIISPLLEFLHALTAVIQAALDRLDGLAAELDQELARTGAAFGRMLQAIPV